MAKKYYNTLHWYLYWYFAIYYHSKFKLENPRFLRVMTLAPAVLFFVFTQIIRSFIGYPALYNIYFFSAVAVIGILTQFKFQNKTELFYNYLIIYMRTRTRFKDRIALWGTYLCFIFSLVLLYVSK